MPQRLFNMLNTPANKFLLRTSLPSILSLSMFGLSLGISSTTFAASISYQQAEQSVLQDSYSTQATQALQQASKLEAEAVKGLGLPRIDLNVRAYAFHNELDVPLGALKNNLEHTLSQSINDRINQQNLPPNISDPLKEGSVHDKFHRTLILSGFCLLKIAKISLNSSFFPKPIKR